MTTIKRMSVEQYEEKAKRHHRLAEFYLFRLETNIIFMTKGTVLSPRGVVPINYIKVINEIKKNLKLYKKHFLLLTIVMDRIGWLCDCAMGNLFLGDTYE